MNTHPIRLRCNDLENPEAISFDPPRLSWEINPSSAFKQSKAFRVEVSQSEEDLLSGSADLWESGWIEAQGTQAKIWEQSPASSLRKSWWRVQVRDQDDDVSEWSAPAYFRYGLDAQTGWKAKWICAGWEGNEHEGAPVPHFQKSFELSETEWNGSLASQSAILSITSLGLYHVEINGHTVSPDELVPGWTDYNKRVVYRSYDVSSLLKNGANTISVLLGDGWYCGHAGWGDRKVWGAFPQLLAQLDVFTTSGSHRTIGSDESWSFDHSGIFFSDFQRGEESIPNSRSPQKKSDPQAAILAPPYKGSIIPAYYTSVRPQENLSPISSNGNLEKGNRLILDFGQNFVGRIAMKLTGPAGSVVTIRYGERLDTDGELYTVNLRKASNIDRCHLTEDGSAEWQSYFTLHGFQYVELTADSPLVKINDVKGTVLHNTLDLTGKFSCSNTLLNKLQQNALWGQKGNFIEVPTDCPQRDERLGWTGDIFAFIETAFYHGNTIAFYKKWLLDMRDSQSEKGQIPPFIPWIDLVPTCMRDGGPAWSDAHIHGMWTIFQKTGRIELLEEHYPSMVSYIDYILREQTKDNIRSHEELEWQGFGDWLGLDGGVGLAGNTPKDLIGTAFLAASLERLQWMAELLNKTKDAQRFGEERDRTIAAFNNRFVTPEGLLSSGTQTAYLLALKFDLLPEKSRITAARTLVKDIRQREWHLTTGFVGTPHLCEVLADNGFLEDAYKLLEQTSYPSWLFPVLNGASTIWERWDGWTPEKGFQDPSMNSFNHYALGAVVGWMFNCVVGIRAQKPGFKVIRFSPRPGGTLDWAKAEVPTPQGMTKLHWTRKDSELTITVTVPPNSTAELLIPDGWKDKENPDSRIHTINTGEHKFRFYS